MADPGEQVVFDLEVQAAQEPGRHPAAAGEVHGRLRLMNGPGVVETLRVRSRQRELRLFHAVRQLKDDAQRGQVPPRGARESTPADAANDDIAEITHPVPLDRQQAVQWPEVDMLPPMKPESFLERCQSGEGAEMDIGIIVRDVDVRVMKDRVLAVPDIRAADGMSRIIAISLLIREWRE